MKCQNYYIETKVFNKKTGKTYIRKRLYPKNYPYKHKQGIKIDCDGNIKVTVNLSLGRGSCLDESYCSCYPEFNIKYKCDKCGSNQSGNMPTSEYDLESYLQEIMDKNEN